MGLIVAAVWVGFKFVRGAWAELSGRVLANKLGLSWKIWVLGGLFGQGYLVAILSVSGFGPNPNGSVLLWAVSTVFTVSGYAPNS